ncbi:hypothetical protein NP233_g8507 [Leucocoprinus birnbaumii]|uniref:Uncharacterized protein n=1 Tax=Leucocoprinus birnbaumii TaxID=56174 RepID=A0AAD5VQT7_9AGAR|nr:hypothetical protein NP233_g8507 [Leucocoprinus birnbaumii]
MRRKSSAQNLLSSFKSATSSTQSVNSIPAVPPPIQTGSGTISSVAGMSIASALSSATTPTVSTPLVRGDSTESQAQYTASLGATSPPLGSSTSVEALRELLQKRLVTLTYIRNVFEGRSYWFHTLHITRAGLEKVFNNGDMKKRTYRFATLALSLSNLLDINSPQDLLRAILNTVTEYDQAKEDSDRPRMHQKKKGVSGHSDYAGSEMGDASYLMMPHMPFALDYHETVLSLVDVVSEVYSKISKILGPSSLPHSSQSLGPLASITPQPGVSYLFASEANNHSTHYPSTTYASTSSSHAPSQQSHLSSASNPNLHQFPSATGSSATLTESSNSGESDTLNSLWAIANACTVGMGMGANSHPTVHWSPVQSEMIVKIDTKLKKLTSLLLKDLDTLARRGIQDELGSLTMLNGFAIPEEPTLSNGAGRTLYDYDA